MEQIRFGKFIRPQFLLVLMVPTIVIAMLTLVFQTDTEAEFEKWNTLVFNSVIVVFFMALLILNVINAIKLYPKQFEFVYRRNRPQLFNSKWTAYIILVISSFFCVFALSGSIPPIIREIQGL